MAAVETALIRVIVTCITASTATVATWTSPANDVTAPLDALGSATYLIIPVDTWVTSYDPTCAGTTFAILDNADAAVTAVVTVDADGNIQVDQTTASTTQVKF